MGLTDTSCRNTKPTDKIIKLTDSHGLYLEVKPNGSKLWRYRYKIGGKENLYAIGEYPKISLAAARTERDEAKKLVKRGIHPAHQRKQDVYAQVSENENTFKALANEWKEANGKKKKWTDYYTKQIDRVFNADVFPLVGNFPIRNISPDQMLAVLVRIEKRGAHTVAILARQWCSAVFCYAIGRRKADTDPTYALRGTIKRPTVQHNKPLPLKEIPAFIKALDEHGGYRTTIISIKLLMLTFVRTKELRESNWGEFDLDNAIWEIPATRMKMREKHLVPLSRQAVELLRELYHLTGGQQWLFPNYRRPADCMTATTINRSLERMGYGGQFSAHGFRSTASTLLHEMEFSSDLIERQLAHSDRNKSRASYNQAQHLPKRREMMQAWADFLDGLKAGGKVIPISRKAATGE